MVEDQDALIQASDGGGAFPFGLMLWESAVAMADEMAARARWLPGLRVLELGCGLGLSGVVAAGLGADVTQTDVDEAALAACRRTAALNAVPLIQTVVGDWHHWPDLGQFDLIIGADVAYDPDDHSALLDVLARALEPDGLALLADPQRTAQASLLALADAGGWIVTTSERHVLDLKPQTPGALRAITLLELKRGV
jgi:predicted nicotinamide N-methyase